MLVAQQQYADLLRILSSVESAIVCMGWMDIALWPADCLGCALRRITLLPVGCVPLTRLQHLHMG